MEFSHELVLPNEDLPFRMFLFEGKDGNYVREKHWHRSIEMFVVLEGKLDFYINEEDIHLDEKSFVIVNSNELHSISAPFPNKTIVLQMPLQTFERYYTDEQFICFTHSERVQDEQLVELVEKMYVTYQKKKTGYELKVQSYFYMLVYLMVTKYRKVDVSAEIVRDHKNRNRLSTITNYIKDNYQKDLSLEGLAQIFGYSPTYLSRMFRKYAEINYKEYIPGHVKEHIVNVETISQPEAQSEDGDKEEEIVHYEDALEELENVLKHETEEDEKDKEVAKG